MLQDTTSPPPKEHSKAILIVAAESEMRGILRIWLEKRGMVVHEASDLESAMRSIFRWNTLGAVICDHRLPDGGAMNFLHWMREQLFSIPFLLITGRSGAGLKRARGFDVVETPITGAALREALSRLVDVDLIEPGSEASMLSAGGKTSKRKRVRKPEVA
jgi:DNA-binding NtrC family response regulator